MRLKKLDEVLKGQPLPDVIRIMMYRPALFGQQFSNTMHELLQGPSEWSSGERELFAAFVSNKNKCRF
ncbi:MAG TPA: hypothetical protein DHW02_06770 [Ktedonobacter sp.]|nr:hypothetical protein [Ktedonobacter sp.]